MRILIAFALALTFAAPQAAAERVHVKSFTGSKRMARKLHKDVVKLIKGKKYKIVSKNADGVIKAKVKKRGKRYKIYLTVLDRNGNAAKKLKYRVTRKGFSAKQRRQVRKKLRAAIRKLPDEAEAEPEPEPEPEEIDEPDDVPDEVATSGDDDGDDSGDSDDSDAEVSRSVSSKGSKAGRSNGHIAGGASVIRRSFGFGTDVGNYKGVPAGGAHVDAVLFPLAFGGKAEGWKDKVGVGVDFDRSVGLKSSFSGTDTTQLPTTQSKFAIDARYRLELGKSKTRPPTIQGVIGVERLSFTIDRSNAPPGVQIMVPDTAYTSIRPGAELWYPVNPKIAILAAAHIKGVIGAGDIVTQQQYGVGSGFGYDFGAGLEYMFTGSLGLQAGLQYDRVNISFEGRGDLSMANPAEFSNSSDTYLGGYASLAFKL